jgi:hypothetical protein
LALYHTMCHSRNKLYLKHPINFAWWSPISPTICNIQNTKRFKII